eukprot:TRINITY_DN4098_c0_g1_i2.p1 TRINITY_DN4098_c0_g1~~TRINITY_DN4098_c0_g1_i2.p1  ORF type:complete len:554 (+),score=117.48 TRINITY_DN4098_c0_g1_i2:1407-3068(+)
MSDRKSGGRSSMRSSMRSSILGDRLGGLADDISVLMEPGLHTEDIDGGHPIRTGAIAFNLLQSTMGVGILSLAGTVSQNGIVLSLLLLIVLSAAAVLSVTLLMKSAALYIKQTKHQNNSTDISFENLAHHCFGSPGSTAVQISLIGMCLVAMASFLVPLKSFLYLILSQFEWFRNEGGRPNSCLLIAMLAVIVPLSMMKRVDKLWITSMMGVLFIFTFVVVSTLYTIYDKLKDTHVVCKDTGGSPGDDGYQIFPETGLSSIPVVLSALAIVTSTFICQLSVFPMLKEVVLNEPVAASSLKMIRATKIAISGVFFLYLVAASSGYILWKEVSEKPTSILACYDPSNPIIAIVYIGMSFSLMFSFPLVLFSARQSIVSLIQKRTAKTLDKEDDEEDPIIEEEQTGSDDSISTNKHILVTMLIIAPVTAVAMIVSSLSSVLGVGGSFFAPMLSFILPAGCFLKLTSEGIEQPQPPTVDSPTCSPTTAEAASLISPTFVSVPGSPFNGTQISFCDTDEESTLILPTRGERAAAWVLLVFGLFSHVACIVGSLLHSIP